MDDKDILHEISQLVDREHHLETQHGTHPLDAKEQDELRAIEVRLDQYWDLLRQRQARREFGQNPDEAKMRSGGTVESYKQ